MVIAGGACMVTGVVVLFRESIPRECAFAVKFTLPGAAAEYVHVNVPNPPCAAIVRVTGTGPVKKVTLPGFRSAPAVGVVLTASASPLFVTPIITVMIWPTETWDGDAMSDGCSSSGCGTCTTTSFSAAVTEIGNALFLSVPRANPVNSMVPAPVPRNVQAKVADPPPSMVTFVKFGPLIMVPAAPGGGSGDTLKYAFVLSAFAPPVFVTVIYILYEETVFEMTSGAHILAVKLTAVSILIRFALSCPVCKKIPLFWSVPKACEVNATCPGPVAEYVQVKFTADAPNMVVYEGESNSVTAPVPDATGVTPHAFNALAWPEFVTTIITVIIWPVLADAGWAEIVALKAVASWIVTACVFTRLEDTVPNAGSVPDALAENHILPA
jgi:hypothetical protein